jgi:hypothetical protein
VKEYFLLEKPWFCQGLFISKQGDFMSKKLKRSDYDELDRAVSEVDTAQESGRSGSHAILVATLAKLGHIVWSVEAAINKAQELLGLGWRNDDDE